MKYPWIPALAAFIAGIFLLPCTPATEPILLIASGITLLAAIILWFLKLHKSSYYIVIVVFLLAGSIQTSRQINFAGNNHISTLVSSGKIQLNKPLEVIGIIAQHPERGSNNLQMKVEVTQITQGRIHYQCSGRLSFYVHLSEDWLNRHISYLEGSAIRFITSLKKPPGFNNPGCFDFPELLRQQKILYTCSVNSPLALEILEKEAHFSPLNIFSSLRSSLEDSIITHFSDSSGLTTKGAFINALILGNRGYLQDQELQPLKRAGLMHITAISGFHIWIIGLMTFGLLRFTRLSERWATVITILVMAFYWAISGGRSSTTRAVIIAVIFLAGRLFSRKTYLANNLAFAALLILFINPLEINNAGFQLTFTAVIAIAVFYNQILKSMEVLRWFGPPLAVSLAAQLGVIPLVAFHFNYVNLHSILSSLIIFPFAAIAIFFSFIFLLFAQFIPVISGFFAGLLSLSFGMFLEITSFADNAFPFSMRLPSPPIWLLILYYLMLAGWLILDRKTFDKNDYPSRVLYFTGLFLMVSAVALIIINPTVHPASGKYRLFALDVGQADSWFFQLPSGKGILIDGGGSPMSDFDVGDNVVSPVLWHLGYRSLDVVIATHADVDHMEGLLAVIRNFEVKELWLSIPEKKPALFRSLIAAAENKGIKICYIMDGVTKTIDSTRISFLSPPANPFRGSDASNNNSAIIHVSFPEGSFLVPGDSEIPALSRVTELYGKQLQSTILMVPHHGSRDALFPGFLEAVSPEIALIGVGHNNVFGFPHLQVREKFHNSGIPLLRTDEMGLISIEFPQGKKNIRTGRDQMLLK